MWVAADRVVRGRWDLVALAVCLVSLVVGCGVAIEAAWRWPLVGDSSLMRYVVMLIHAGRRPYSEIVEINLPGSYLLEYLAMRVFGWGAHGLRLYDGFLCGVVAVAAWRLGRSRRDGWFCLAGGLVVVLVHLQDGLEQGGQRDFALAALLLCSVAVLERRLSWPRVLVFELLVGMSLTIKPTLILLALAPLLMREGGVGRERWRVIVAGVVGLAVPVVGVGLWLWREWSLGAFVGVVRSIGVLHGELGRRSLGFLLGHCTSPVLGILVLGVGALVVVRRLDAAERLLMFGAGCGLVSYLYQGKGLPYQRYPFLGAAVVLAFLGFSRALEGGVWARGLGFAGVIFCVVWVVPRSVRLVRGFDAVAPFEEALGRTLVAENAAGTVQCLDTYGGCVNTLYDLRMMPATGYLYDCYGFTGPGEVRDRYREGFLRAFEAARPRVVVLTDQQCFTPGNSFARVAEWPELAGILDRDYAISQEWHADRTVRWWSRAEMPNGFRVYVRK